MNAQDPVRAGNPDTVRDAARNAAYDALNAYMGPPARNAARNAAYDALNAYTEPPARNVANNPTVALWKAVRAGNLNKVNAAIAAGGNVNSRNSRSDLPILHAAILLDAGHHNMEIADILIQNGADIDMFWFESTPLQVALSQGNSNVAYMLINRGANIHLPGMANKVALDIAAEFASDEVVELLLAHGANVNRRGSSGHPPIVHALFRVQDIGSSQVDILLNAGADLQMVVEHNFVSKSIHAWACEGFYGQSARNLICSNGGKRRTRRRNTRRRNTRRRSSRKNRK